MHHDRPNARIHPVQHALRLAKGVTQQHRGAARVRVAAPPVVDLVKQHRLRRPAVDRQAKGRFGDEGVAANRLKRRAGAVGLGLVVARRHPDPTAMLQPHLGRAKHMARRVQRQPHAVVLNHLAICQRLQRDVGAQPLAQRASAVRVGQIVRVAPARVVRMRVGDHGPLHRSPGVDVEIARRAIQAFGAGDDEVGSGRGVDGGHGKKAVCRRAPIGC